MFRYTQSINALSILSRSIDYMCDMLAFNKAIEILITVSIGICIKRMCVSFMYLFNLNVFKYL